MGVADLWNRLPRAGVVFHGRAPLTVFRSEKAGWWGCWMSGESSKAADAEASQWRMMTVANSPGEDTTWKPLADWKLLCGQGSIVGPEELRCRKRYLHFISHWVIFLFFFSIFNFLTDWRNCMNSWGQWYYIPMHLAVIKLLQLTCLLPQDVILDLLF